MNPSYYSGKSYDNGDRHYPKKQRKKAQSWSEEEDRKLTNEYESGQFSTRDLSEIHGRTTGAIRARLKKLKLIKE